MMQDPYERCPLGHHMAGHLHFTLCDIWPDCAISNCVSLLLRRTPRPASTIKAAAPFFWVSYFLSVPWLSKKNKTPTMSTMTKCLDYLDLSSSAPPMSSPQVGPDQSEPKQPVAAQPAQHLDSGSLIEKIQSMLIDSIDSNRFNRFK